MTFHCIIFLSIPFLPILAIMSGDDESTAQFGNTKPSNERINYINNAFTIQEPCSVNDPKQSFNCPSSKSEPICKDGYVKFSKTECVKRAGQSCVFNQNDCSTHLTYMVCVNNVCVCDATDRYDPESKKCVGRVGGLCYPNIKECTENAMCLDVPIPRKRASRSSPFSYQTNQLQNYVLTTNSDIEVSGRCHCKEGYVESRDGLCKKGYSQPCQSFDDCDSLYLVCREGMCDCPNSLHVYDLVSKTCVALVGADYSDEVGGTVCVESAYCKKRNSKLPGRCSCIENAGETNVRTCMLPPEVNVGQESDSASSGWIH